MLPTPELIADAAYFRWLRRGGGHGRDREDWAAAEKDLTFGLNYRWVVRHALRPAAGTGAGPVLLGKPQSRADGGPRRCRYCEQAEPAAAFGASARPWALPGLSGESAMVVWDECDDCRSHYEAHLAGPFEAFLRPMVGPEPAPPEGIPLAALKALVRLGLAVLPAAELHHFDDATEWVSNPDPGRDVALLRGLGCRVYVTPAPVAAPFASLARRSADDAPLPYMLFFLGAGRVVLQTRLPFCPRDEDLDDDDSSDTDAACGPELSMSMAAGGDLRASRATFLPVVAPEPGPGPARGRAVANAAGVGR